MADTPDDLRQVARALRDNPPEYFSLDTLHEANHLARVDPAALTDRHLRHLAVYEPQNTLALVQKRAAAQHADRDAAERRAADAFTAAQQAAAPEPPAVDVSGVKDFADLAARCPHAPVTMEILADVVAFAGAMNAKNIERNQKIAALEKQLVDLRVELDALIMVRS